MGSSKIPWQTRLSSAQDLLCKPENFLVFPGILDINEILKRTWALGVYTVQVVYNTPLRPSFLAATHYSENGCDLCRRPRARRRRSRPGVARRQGREPLDDAHRCP